MTTLSTVYTVYTLREGTMVDVFRSAEKGRLHAAIFGGAMLLIHGNWGGLVGGELAAMATRLVKSGKLYLTVL